MIFEALSVRIAARNLVISATVEILAQHAPRHNFLFVRDQHSRSLTSGQLSVSGGGQTRADLPLEEMEPQLS